MVRGAWCLGGADLCVIARISFEPVAGAERYVLRRGDDERRCTVIFEGVCDVVLTRRPADCSNRLVAIDGDRESTPSEPFCIEQFVPTTELRGDL